MERKKFIELKNDGKMLQFFKKWCESLQECLRHGDLQTISAETDLSYHQVRRILVYGTGEDESREKVLKVANELIQKRAQEEQKLTKTFNKELILEKQRRAQEALEEFQQLESEKED